VAERGVVYVTRERRPTLAELSGCLRGKVTYRGREADREAVYEYVAERGRRNDCGPLPKALESPETTKVSDEGWLDANVIVLYLVGEPEADWRRADALMRRAGRGEFALHVHAVTVVEVVWVLEKAYRVPRPDIARLVEGILLADGIKCEEGEALVPAPDDFVAVATRPRLGVACRNPV